MKKILSTAFICLCVLQLSAQTEQGKILMGATSNLGLSVLSQDAVEDNNFNLSLNAQGGYFVIDNLAAGLNLGFGVSNQGDISVNSFVVGPFGRYYFDNVFFGAGFSFINTNRDDGITDLSSSGSQIGLELGYAAFINNNVAIEPALTYFNTGGDFDGQTSIALNIGFTIYLAP